MGLQAAHRQILLAQGADAVDGCLRRRQGGDQRDLHACGQCADLRAVVAAAGAERRVDDQVDLAVAHGVEGGVLSFAAGDGFGQIGDWNPHLFHEFAGAFGGVEGEAHAVEITRQLHRRALVVIVDGDEHAAAGR